MFSHVYISVGDFEKSVAFYSKLMECLRIKQKFCDSTVPRAAWHGEETRPLFVIGRPYDGEPHQPGNGQMVAFNTSDRRSVEETYRLAISNGAVCQGRPGMRTHYHENYYGAYFKDLDGNKVCIVCHEAQ